MPEQRRGFSLLEIVLIAVALCVMVALGIAAASALTQGPAGGLGGLESSEAPSPAPIIPPVEAVQPTASGTQISPEWVAEISQQTGVGSTALRAYGSAALRIGREQPACRLGWTTLAAIGGIESEHGTYRGAELLADGTTSQPIVGPALDGTNGTAAIAATEESQRWHGDDTWDHAVGPMQFIPSTWQQWQSDGDGDGSNDPGNIFDAAYAAGRYLCASGAGLTTGPGWSQAIFSYNRSNDYVRSVLAFANAYGGS